jgi:hypothetical protein
MQQQAGWLETLEKPWGGKLVTPVVAQSDR